MPHGSAMLSLCRTLRGRLMAKYQIIIRKLRSKNPLAVYNVDDIQVDQHFEAYEDVSFKGPRNYKHTGRVDMTIKAVKLP